MPTYEQPLDDTLVLRAVRNEQDMEKYHALYVSLGRETGGRSCSLMMHHHPEMSPDDFLFVEDERDGQVVSTTCLIPWHCRYEDISLDVAMLEAVTTHPEYRHRGLIRAQVQRFHEMVDERHYDLSIIQGIPYYYRQYGYSYALDCYPTDSLPAWRIT